MRSLALAANPGGDAAAAVADLAAHVEAAVAGEGAIAMDSPAVSTYLAAQRAKYVKATVSKLAAENPVAVRQALGQ